MSVMPHKCRCSSCGRSLDLGTELQRRGAAYMRGVEAALAEPDRNRLAEAFIRGPEAGAEAPELAGDGNAMYARFRAWIDGGSDG